VLLGRDPDPHSKCGSESRRAKIMVTTKIEKSKEIFMFEGWMFSLSADGFSCSLGVLYGGLVNNNFS
jgi:hypothetical protein